MSGSFDLGSLAQRFGLGPDAAGQLARLGLLLAEDPEAPTTVRTPDRVRDDHLADSLVGLELPEVARARSIADLGSGAGLPGLPLAIALPEASVILVESNGRKCDFLRRAVQRCGIHNVDVRWGRAEEVGAAEPAFDLVTARALAPLSVVAEYAAPLLRVGGHLVAWRGRPEPEVEAEAARAAEILGLCVREPVRVRPYSSAHDRFLHVMSKVSATPPEFPRRPGMARKRPLGGSGPVSDRERR